MCVELTVSMLHNVRPLASHCVVTERVTGSSDHRTKVSDPKLVCVFVCLWLGVFHAFLGLGVCALVRTLCD